MGSFRILRIVFFSLYFFSCQKETFNPNRFDDLIYRAEVFKPSTTLEANIEGTDWAATIGKGQADSTVIEISGTSAQGDKLYFKLLDFKTQKKFLSLQGLDSVYVQFKNIMYNDFSEGVSEVNIIKIDTIGKVIEGDFLLNLKDNGGKVLKITKGYFKILYKEEFMRFLFNEQPWTADTLWVKVDTLTKPNSIAIYGVSTKNKSTLQIVMSLDQASSTSFKLSPQIPYLSLQQDKQVVLFNRAGGSLRVLQNDKNTKTIVATFSAQLTSFDAISTGKFSINY